jgi:hypothetical protein
MDHLFSQMYSGASNPFAPHQFLYSIWKYVDDFACYDQQGE